MKKTILLLASGLVFAAIASSSHAAARSPSNLGREYAVGSQALDKWSAGVYYNVGEKDVELKRFGDRNMKSSRAMVYVGYDALPWLTPYLTLGQNDTKIRNIGVGGGQYSDSSAQYGLGLLFNILDHEVADPHLMEDRLRVNAGVEYTWTSTDYRNDELGWSALDASLTIGIVNDVASGNYLYVPDSIVIYTGPIYSKWSGSDIEGATKARDEFGYTVGLEVFYTPSVAFNLQFNFLDHDGLTAGLNLRF